MTALPDNVVMVEVNNGAFVETYSTDDVPTIGAIVAKFRDDHGFRFAQDPTVFDPSNSRMCNYSEAVKGGNEYAMTCWIIQKVDSAGNPSKRSALMQMGEVIKFPQYPDHASPFDLGEGFSFKFASWAPDRTIPANAERYKEIPDVERICILLTCPHGKEGVCHLDRGEIYKDIFGDRPWWTVVVEEPLTLEPSIDTGCCHGWIRQGRWVDA